MLSPISETDSNQYATLDSHGQTVRRINPQEERKLTGTGTYNIDAYGAEEDEDNYSSDEFESDDDESNSSMILQDSSGSTVDTSDQGGSSASRQANQQKELERVVEAYNMILENTATEEDFE